jgi:hypothetical protein
MAAPTKLTGYNGIVKVATVTIDCEEFSINIKRGLATQSRVGKISDIHKAGKVEVTGTVTFVDISGAQLQRLFNKATVAAGTHSLGEAATFTIEGEATDGTSSVKVTAANCFFTGAAIKFGDANSFIDTPMTWAMEDADADLTLTYT